VAADPDRLRWLDVHMIVMVLLTNGKYDVLWQIEKTRWWHLVVKRIAAEIVRLVEPAACVFWPRYVADFQNAKISITTPIHAKNARWQSRQWTDRIFLVI
jgi:hypothetical protein